MKTIALFLLLASLRCGLGQADTNVIATGDWSEAVGDSDGHTLDGKVLWCRQPALDGNLPPYSEQHPRPNPAIVWIGALRDNEKERLKNTGSGEFIGISFNSRQAGVLDVKSGDFTFQGQN